MSTLIGINKIPNGVNTGLFAQTTSSATITNTTTESSIIGSGLGTLSVPANEFKEGDSFLAVLSGRISAANNNGIRLNVKSGVVVLGTTGNFNLPGITDKFFDLYIHFTIRSLGSAGTASIVTSGQFTYSKDAGNAFEGKDFVTVNNTTFNTTVDNGLDVTVQWDTASAQNSIVTELFVLNKIY